MKSTTLLLTRNWQNLQGIARGDGRRHKRLKAIVLFFLENPKRFTRRIKTAQRPYQTAGT